MIDENFARITAEREGEVGRRWLAGLPGQVSTLLERWQLRVEGVTSYGFCSMVLPVRRADGQPAVLKLGWLDEETRGEPLALKAWDGRGAVKLLDLDEGSGAMLLERLDPEHDLHELPIDQAMDVAACLLSQLRVPAVAGLPKASELAERWQKELPANMTETLAELAEGSDEFLLHGDFHYANVLRGNPDQWTVIDPKPMNGDPAYDVVPLLRNRWDEIKDGGSALRRIHRFAERAELDPGSMLRWSLARSVEDALWFTKHQRPKDAAISWDIAKTLRA